MHLLPPRQRTKAAEARELLNAHASRLAKSVHTAAALGAETADLAGSYLINTMSQQSSHPSPQWQLRNLQRADDVTSVSLHVSHRYLSCPRIKMM